MHDRDAQPGKTGAQFPFITHYRACIVGLGKSTNSLFYDKHQSNPCGLNKAGQ